MSARDDAFDGLDSELGVLVRRVRRAMWEKSVHVVLGHIAEHGPERAADLCAVIGSDKAAISRHVQHLLERGYVEGSPDPEDGRATLLTATDSGRAQLEEINGRRRAQLQTRLADWDTAELARFVADLGRYNRDLSMTDSLSTSNGQ